MKRGKPEQIRNLRAAAQTAVQDACHVPRSPQAALRAQVHSQQGPMCPAGRAHLTGKSHLNAERPRTAASHRWAGLVARLLALLLFYSVTCAAAATGGAAVRPSACTPGTPASLGWPLEILCPAGKAEPHACLCQQQSRAPAALGAGQSSMAVLGTTTATVKPGSRAGLGPEHGAVSVRLLASGGSRAAC